MKNVIYIDGTNTLLTIELPKHLQVISNLILLCTECSVETDNKDSIIISGFNYLTDQLVEIFCKEKGLDPSKYSLEFFTLSESEIKEGYVLKLFIFEIEFGR